MLTTQQKLLLQSWLEEFSALGRYQRCWRGLSFFTTSYSFEDCYGKPNTLTIAKLHGGNEIYGGYTDVAWNGKHLFAISFLVEIDYLVF